MRDGLEELAASLPGAFLVVQWGDAHVYKVGTAEKAKVFAILGLQTNRITVKCQDVDTAAFLIEIGRRSGRNICRAGAGCRLIWRRLTRMTCVSGLPPHTIRCAHR